MSQFFCPECDLPLDPAKSVDGIVTCEGCQTPYSVPTPQLGQTGTEQREAASIGTGESDLFSSDDPFDLPLEGTPISPSAAIHPFELQTDETEDRRPTKWLPYVAAAIVLGCIGLFGMVLMSVISRDGSDSGEDSAGGAGTAQIAASELDDSPDPVEPSEDLAVESESSGGVLDLSDLNALDDLETMETMAPAVEAARDLESNRYGWPQSVALVSIPSGQIGSVDGVAQVDWTDAGLSDKLLTLPVPAGNHQVRAAAGTETLSVKSTGFAEYYSQQLAAFRGDEGLDLKKLSERLVASGGVFHDPVLPHLVANAYWQSGQVESAVRFWNAAIRLSPSFAPSHLNLAFAAHQRSETEVANRELYLATILNVQDTFGIARHITKLRRELPESIQEVYQFNEQDYFPSIQYDQTTQKVINVLTTLKELAADPADRAACLNNIGVHLMHKTQDPESAFNYFLQAQQELSRDGPVEPTEVSNTILDNLVLSAERGMFAEAELFRRVRSARQ